MGKTRQPKRYDPNDGHLYTRKEFIVCYGTFLNFQWNWYIFLEFMWKIVWILMFSQYFLDIFWISGDQEGQRLWNEAQRPEPRNVDPHAP